MTGNNTLLPCHDSRCQTCAQYYLNCSSCEASFTLQLNNYTSLNECQHYPFCNESKAEENTCRPVECNITKLEVMMNNKTCKLATELISKLVYSHPKEEFRIILTDWNSETIKIEPFATDFIQLHQIDPFIQNDPGYQLIYNKDYRLAFDETAGVKYLRVEFLTQKTETSQLVRMKMAPISFRRIISQRRLVEVQAEPFSVTDVGVKTLNDSSSEEKFLKFMGDFGVLAILTFVPFLCFCWRNMQVAIYSLQMLSSVHIWNMLAGPSTNSMQIIPENHKIYKMVLFVQSLSDNSSCRISGLWSGHSEDFLLIRNVNCSVSYSILIIVGGVFVIFAVLALVMQCFGKNTFEWKTEIEYNEWKFNRRNQRYLSTVSVAYGVWKGLEPASLLYSGVLLSHNYLLFSSYALILIFVIMFAVGLYCGIQLYTRFKTAKVDPADRTYQDAVGSTDEVLGVLNQFGMFHWMDDSPLNKNILVYLEPTITSLRNILLVVFVFVCHKNSVSQHYWILGLMGLFTLLEFYLIYQSFDKGRPVRMASRILLIMVNWAFLGLYFFYKFKSLKDDYSISESKEDGKWLLWTTMSFFFANVAVGLITLIIQGDQTLPKRQSSENFTSNDQEEPLERLDPVPSKAQDTPPREKLSENVSHDTRRNLIEQHSPDSGSNSPDRLQAHRRMLIVLASDSDHSVGQRQSNHSDSIPHTKIEPLTVGTTKTEQ